MDSFALKRFKTPSRVGCRSGKGQREKGRMLFSSRVTSSAVFCPVLVRGMGQEKQEPLSALYVYTVYGSRRSKTCIAQQMIKLVKYLEIIQQQS